MAQTVMLLLGGMGEYFGEQTQVVLCVGSSLANYYQGACGKPWNYLSKCIS
jgi:hypothetical protein